jgi:hypothetical protein
MTRHCAKHGLSTAPLASRLINQRAAAPWITLPRRFRDNVTAVSRHRDRDFAETVTV